MPPLTFQEGEGANTLLVYPAANTSSPPTIAAATTFPVSNGILLFCAYGRLTESTGTEVTKADLLKTSDLSVLQTSNASPIGDTKQFVFTFRGAFPTATNLSLKLYFGTTSETWSSFQLQAT
jgi:hypothetical protein